MKNTVALIEAAELRDFYQAKLELIEAKLDVNVGSYMDLLEHDTLATRINGLNQKINQLMHTRRARAPFWKKILKK